MNKKGAQQADRTAGCSSPLKIGELAKATGKTARALRLYEEMGLLKPGTRTDGGFRMYGHTAIDHVKWISHLQDIGFSLPELQDVVDGIATEGIPREGMGRLRDALERKLREVDDQLKHLQFMRDEVFSALSFLDGCGTCEKPGAGPQACVQCGEQEETRDHPRLVRGATKTATYRNEEVVP